MTQTSKPDRAVPTRRISFEESLRDLPKHFAADGDLIQSHFAATLSALFPDGEDFFVRSVRHYRDQITDPVLKRQVAGFIGQEAMHGREHRALNGRLHALGYPTKGIERFTKWGLEARERILPPISNLALTAALEHFTATLAELLLSDPELQRQFGHEQLKNLFLWHALEESEHKAVAFDVYKAVGGSERVRVWTMNFITATFISATTIMMIISLLRDRATYRRGALRHSWRSFRRSPLMRREVWRAAPRLQPPRLPSRRPRHRGARRPVERRTVWRAGVAERQTGHRRRLSQAPPIDRLRRSRDLGQPFQLVSLDAQANDTVVPRLDIAPVDVSGAGLEGEGDALERCWAANVLAVEPEANGDAAGADDQAVDHERRPESLEQWSVLHEANVVHATDLAAVGVDHCALEQFSHPHRGGSPGSFR